MTDTISHAVLLEREIWKPPRRVYVIVAVMIASLLVVVVAPVVALGVHQSRLNSQSTSIAQIRALDVKLQMTQRALLAQQKALKASTARESADRARAHYETCETLLKMWQIDDAVILYETGPGQERQTLLNFLPVQPVCKKP